MDKVELSGYRHPNDPAHIEQTALEPNEVIKARVLLLAKRYQAGGVTRLEPNGSDGWLFDLSFPEMKEEARNVRLSQWFTGNRIANMNTGDNKRRRMRRCG